MNFQQLNYIVSVDKNRNFARAAEECQVAQSTLSREIQRLEKEFDILIFDRSRHPVVPTMKGSDLIEQAKKILKEQQKFNSIAKQRNNEPIGNFRLGVLSSIAPYLLPLFSQQVVQKYPELNLEIFELGSTELLHELESENLDGAVDLFPFQKEGLYETPLYEEEFMLYINSEHPLFGKEKVKWSDIALDDLILQEEMKSYFLKKEGSKSLLEEKHLRNISFQNSSLETIRKIIDRNGGMTLIPQLACLYMGERRLKMVRKIEDAILSRTVGFVSPRGFEKNRIAKVLREEIMKSIPKEW